MAEETDGRREPEAENSLPEEKFRKLEIEADLRLKEDAIRNVLSPYEGSVMTIQGLLVWENPRRSFVLLLCVNGFVWLMVTSNYNIVFKATLSVITIVTVQTFYKKVWPDIKVEPKVPTEGWVPLDPELVQFHDLCHYAALTWQYSQQKHQDFWQLRKEKPGKFCLLVCILCLGIFLFGLRVSGAAATYLLASSLVIFPGIIHHNLHQHLFTKMKPYLIQMEHSMDMPGKGRKKKRARQRSSKQRVDDTDDADYSSSDSELDEFIPTPGPALDAAFAHAAAPYEKTPGSSSRVTPVSGLVEGLMPKGASLELTDDDLLTDNENNSLAFGPMEGIPAYDESDSMRLRRRPKPAQRTLLQPPQAHYRPQERLLTQDMAETHFQTIPPNDFSNGSEPFSSEEDLLDTSPDAITEDLFEEDPPEGGNFPPELPDIREPEHISDEPKTESTPDSTGSLGEVFTPPPIVVDEPKQEPSLLPKTAADLLSQTVASVTAFINRDRSQPSPEAATPNSSEVTTHLDSGPSSMEMDLSEYEIMDKSEIDNVRNTRTENESKDSSFTEFFSNMFGKKT